MNELTKHVKELYSVPVKVSGKVGRPVKKAKFHVKVDIYENGAAVTIKNGKRILGSRLFTGDNYTKEYADWVDKKLTDPANLKKATKI